MKQRMLELQEVEIDNHRVKTTIYLIGRRMAFVSPPSKSATEHEVIDFSD